MSIDQNWGKTSRINHWIMAAAILSMLSFGIWLEYFLADGPDKGWFIANHKADGVIVLIFALWRVGYRVKNGFMADASPMPKWQSVTSHAVHWLLLIGVIAVPLIALTGSFLAGRDVSVFGLFTIPSAAEPNKPLAEICMELHGYLAYGLCAVLALHIAGAIKHHYIDKDSTLKRMLGRA